MFEQRIRKELNAQLNARPPLARLLARPRQNFALKMIALSISILLYFYVQADRNPVLQRTFRASVIPLDTPPDLELKLEKTQVIVTISGPADMVERLTDKDIHAVIDLSNAAHDAPKMQAVRARFEVTGLDRPMLAKLTLDPPEPTVKAQLFTTVTRLFPVHPVYPKDSPAWFDYGLPDLKPVSVKVTGRSDRVNRVAQLIVEAKPAETGAHIAGDFPVVPRDSEDNLVSDIKIEPSMAHLIVPLVAKPPSKIVTISAMTSGLPLPPYSVTKITVTPAQIRITGQSDALTIVSTIPTEIIPLGDLTQTQEITAHLVAPTNVALRDTNNRAVDTVKIRIEIEKAPDPTASKPDAKAAPTGTAKIR